MSSLTLTAWATIFELKVVRAFSGGKSFTQDLILWKPQIMTLNV